MSSYPHQLHLFPTAWLSNLSSLIFPPSSLQDELQELEGVSGLAVLSIPAHHWHLCPGAMGKVHLQLDPLLSHRHGDLHLICLCAHPRAPGTGVFLQDLWRPAWEHHGTHELTIRREYGGQEAVTGWISMCPQIISCNLAPRASWACLYISFHPKPQQSVTSANQDWKHEDLNGMIWKAEPYYLLYIPNPLALPHGIKHTNVHYFHILAVKCLVKCCLS